MSHGVAGVSLTTEVEMTKKYPLQSAEWLSGILAEIAALAGRDAALALARRHGGTVIRVPKIHEHLSRAAWRSEVSDEAADAIWRGFKGDSFYIPMCRQIVGCWLAEQGLDPATIAAELRVSLRTVQRWFAGPRKLRSGDGAAGKAP